MSVLAQVPWGTGFYLRTAGRILLTIWALFWTWFNVMAGFGELASSGPGGLVGHLGMAAIVLGVTAVAWRWGTLGGVVLIALTAGMAWFFRGVAVETALLLLAPSTIAGLLLLLASAISTLEPRQG